MHIKKNSYFAIVSLFLLFFPGVVSAEETQENTGEEDIAGLVGFTHEVITPDNQIGEPGYFNLMMEPGQEQTIEIALLNHGDKETTIDVRLNGAKTNANGVIEYGKNNLDYADSAKFKFEEIVTGPKEIVLKPKTEERLKLTIKMPETSIKGMILGGVQLQEKTDSDSQSSDGAMVINEYAYTTAIILRENNDETQPDMGFVKAYAYQKNYRNSIGVDLSNQQPEILEDLTIEAQVMKDNSDEVLYESKKTGLRMAPNTVINFPVSMEGQRMEAGKYRTHVVATAGSQSWEWEESFSISAADADKFNREDIGLDQDRGIDWKLIAIIVGGALATLVVVFGIIYAFRRKKKPVKRKKKKANGR